jgi:tetratricopeptide (TPR) repeat protein
VHANIDIGNVRDRWDVKIECWQRQQINSRIERSFTARAMDEMTDSQGERIKWEEMGPAEIIARLGPPHPLPTKVWLLMEYADALRMVGLHKRALEVFEVIANTPMPWDKKYLLPLFRGRTYLEMGRPSEAEADFREAVVLDPDRSTSAWIQVAAAQAHQERFADAIETLRAATGLSGDPEEVYLNLGMFLRTLGRLPEAAENLQKALSIDPEYRKAREVLRDVERALLVS